MLHTAYSLKSKMALHQTRNVIQRSARAMYFIISYAPQRWNSFLTRVRGNPSPIEKSLWMRVLRFMEVGPLELTNLSPALLYVKVREERFFCFPFHCFCQFGFVIKLPPTIGKVRKELILRLVSIADLGKTEYFFAKTAYLLVYIE